MDSAFGRKMKRPILITAMALFAATGVGFAVWRVHSDGNLASDEPPFNSIELPLRNIRGDIWMDGGSVWVGVVDSKGASFDFIFPYDYKTKGYPTAFHSASMPKTIYPPDAVSLANPARARAIVLTWLRRNESHDEGLERALDYLSGYSHSILRRIELDGIRGVFQ